MKVAFENLENMQPQIIVRDSREILDANSLHHSGVPIVSEAMRASGRFSISYYVIRDPYMVLQILYKILGRNLDESAAV